jgi:hypothetical protein
MECSAPVRRYVRAGTRPPTSRSPVERSAFPRPPGGAAHCAGPPLTAQGRLRRRSAIATATLDLRASAAPEGKQCGQAQGPALVRGAARRPASAISLLSRTRFVFAHPLSVHTTGRRAAWAENGCVNLADHPRAVHDGLTRDPGVLLAPISLAASPVPPHDRCFGAFPAVFGRFRAEASIMVVRPAFGGAARRRGWPVACPRSGPA